MLGRGLRCKQAARGVGDAPRLCAPACRIARTQQRACCSAVRVGGPSDQSVARRQLLAGLAVVTAGGSLLSGPACRPAGATVVDEDVAEGVFASVAPSVVAVQAMKRVAGGGEVPENLGSGVLWDAAGPHVLCNFHQIPSLKGTDSRLRVTVVDAKTGAPTALAAFVAGTDSLHDLAVLRLLPEGGGAEDGEGEGEGAGPGAGLPALQPVKLGTSADVKVGQTVYALGGVTLPGPGPGSLSHSMSAGLVSGLGRSIPSPVGARIYGVIQTEAVINGANSGGPLVDSAGRMVGLSTAVGGVRNNRGRGSGVFFALPADQLLDLVPKVALYGNAYGKK